MKKTELQSLVQECIAEVLNEKYSEFQRVDKGSKGVAAKDKAEEDTYGAGYAAGEKAAKAKYKKLAEAYKQLKEDGFGIGPRGMEVNDGGEDRPISEAVKLSTDAKSVVDMIEKQPMILQKLKLVNTRDELESIFDYLLAKINPQLSSSPVNIRTAASNAAQNLAKEPEKMEEARFEKGEDVGKPGKNFAKIAKSAAKRYGSKKAGERVAGAMLNKVLTKEANKDVYAGFGDTWYDTSNKPYTGGFDFEYDEETFDNLDDFMTKYKDKQKFFTPGDLSTRIFDKYKQKHGPLKIRIKK